MFPKYYVLDQLLEKHKTKDSVRDYFIISVQHLMRSTGSLFETLINWGIEPPNIFLTGKIYSAHHETIKKIYQLGINIKRPTLPTRLGYYADFLEKDVLGLWEELKKALTPNAKIIILDDGGFVLKNVPSEILKNYSVFGIEQTTSGVHMQNAFKEFPVINVATSAAKTIIEPPIVSESVKIQLGEVIRKLEPQAIGIIGFGHIGKATANEFCNDYKINVFDINDNTINKTDNRFTYFDSKEALFSASEVIVGTTGKDISDLRWLQHINGNKTLISVSSGDIEFNSLIRNCASHLMEEFKSPLQELRLMSTNGNEIRILRGGLVANFTGKPDSSPGYIIQMTRGLLFSAIIQIFEDNFNLKKYSGSVILKPSLQKEVVNYWFSDQSDRRKIYGNEIIDNFQDLAWIKKHSQ